MTLIDMPTTGSIYRGAITGIVRRRTATVLPGEALRVDDVAVDPARLAAYEQVCGFAPGAVVPSTYLHVLGFPIAMRLMNAPGFPFRVIGLVHIANTITQVRPVGPAERLSFTVSATDLRAHDRGRQFDVHAAATVDGVEVWRGVSTYLRRDRSAASGRGSVDEPPAADAIWPVGRGVGRAYARVSGDRNPIHVSTIGARMFGFPQPIAHGMWSAARCLAAVQDGLPTAYAYRLVFKRPIPLPSTVAFTRLGANITLTAARSGTPHLTATLT